jgi:hypothetical protein
MEAISEIMDADTDSESGAEVRRSRRTQQQKQ